MSSRSLVRCPASYSAVNGCFTYKTPRSRNYCQCSLTTSFESLQVGHTILPHKLRKPTQRKNTFSAQRKIVPQCLSDLRTSCREEVPNYLAINLLQEQLNTRQGTPRKVLVILNPNSGLRSSRHVFYKKVQLTLKLSGFMMEVIETAYAGHAKAIASTIDLSKFPDGIICVGGDGIVNEVLNGLLGRDNWKEAIQLPIGIIPAGSDNSLVWTVLGIRDPVSAANALAKLMFGPFRYVVAGFLKFLSLPKYKFEVEYLPSSPRSGLELKPLTEKCHEQLSDCGKVMSVVQNDDGIQDNWVTRKGEFLGIFLCNHLCKPARGLLSPVIAPKAQHDDGALDLILVHGNGRLRLFCFFTAYQLSWHLLLPFVEYVKASATIADKASQD